MSAPPSYNEAIGAPASEPEYDNEKRGRRINEQSVGLRGQETVLQNQVYNRSNGGQSEPAVHANGGPARNTNGIPLPCVIPQTSKSFRGPFYSPFVRAYVPGLEAYGIDEETFLACLDGLNEAFIASPAFQGLDLVGQVMGQFYGVHPVQLAGMGLSMGAGVGSAATSIARTKAYVKSVNANLFNPSGLHLNILTTAKMMEKIQHPTGELKLPTVDANAAADSDTELSHAMSEQDNPQMRRLQALEGYVMPLKFDVPKQVMPDNFLRKMGAAQSERLEKKQTKKMMKERQEAGKKYDEKSREAEKKQREGDNEIAKLERKLEKERAKMEKDYAKDGEKAVSKFQKEEAEITKEIEKELAKRDKEVAKQMKDAESERGKGTKKEDKAAQKMRWIVITRYSGEQNQDAGEGEGDDTI